jgi:glycosyltransferase involved in cell wall biosynthesis
MKPLKIAIVNKFFFLKGGQETVALEQMKLLKEHRIEVAFFSMHHPKNDQSYPWTPYFVDHADFSLQQDTKPTAWDKLKLASRFIANGEAAKKFRLFLEKFQPDVIHCHGIAHQLTYTILREAKKLDIPVVQTLHDYQVICPSYTLLKGNQTICTKGCTRLNYLPCIQNRCVKGSLAASALSSMEMFYNRTLFDYTTLVDVFVSPSQFLARQVINSGIEERKVKVVPNFLTGIDKITPEYSNQGYFLYVGRLSHEKGLKTLLKAFQQVPEGKLLIAGEGPMQDELVSYTQNNSLNHVTFLGFLDRNQIANYISDAIAVILPSEWYENQPMSIIEAFSHGTPVIASDMGGISEMIEHDQTGYLFPAGDSDSLKNIIQNLLSNSGKSSGLGVLARKQALSKYNSELHIATLLGIYTDLKSKIGTR